MTTQRIALDWKAEQRDFGSQVALLGYSRVGGEVYAVLKPIEGVMHHDSGENAFQEREPSMVLAANSARSLMTALWEAGVRPYSFNDPRGEIARMEAHIKDLQQVIWNPGTRGP